MSSDIPNEPKNRLHPIHLPVLEIHNRATIVFLTVCTKGRQPVLATPKMHRSLKTAWVSAAHWLVGRYVVMPDHIHLFCAPSLMPPTPLVTWISYWKRLVAQSMDCQIWQKNFWDTQLRRHESYAQKWEYVRNNPMRAGLVQKADEWEFQGEMNVLRWHE